MALAAHGDLGALAHGVGNMLFASYLKDAQTQIKVFDMKGKFVREVALPGIGSAGAAGIRCSGRSRFSRPRRSSTR